MSRFAGKKVLVTGADGFIGSHLVERLIAEGADVRAFCVYNSNGSYGWLDELGTDRIADIEVQLGDIRDGRSVRKAVTDVDVVFHLAALVAIPYSYQAPESFVDTNITGTLNMLEAVRDAGGVRMVNTSTSEVYGTPESVPIRETHPLRGQSPYAASKIAADQLCEAYARSFEAPVTTLRPFNTYGPRQSMRAVIPTILGQLLSGATSVRLGSLTPRRDLTFVTDTVDGFVRMGCSDLPPGSLVQLGTGQTASIGELFQLCCEVTGVDAEVVTDRERVRPDASEVQVLLSEPSLAKEKLDWQATKSLADGLAETARWLAPRVDAARAGRYHR
ncbi:SDR family NAD(P)-dependent oxidoreductase [Prauserella endophytica]|uniref:SDR family NAD(P)-dependent oxidoreductase n=1 Tax=Prauserella endophytica TaxID=1592324 RepID=UPI000D8DA83A|nr:SDR family NAD(P)-dependent oxidoreductase [Prauserella endophytica]PXY24895.1 NAD-dependent dehydratase [Prauserella coralliicola]